MIITIDGPTASGKSTVARAVARKLGIYYIASGSIYRAVGCILLHSYGYTLDILAAVQPEHIDQALDTHRFLYIYDAINGEQIFYDNHDLTPELGKSEMGSAASVIGTDPMVRAKIIEFIRKLAHDHSIVIDGRDCGSVMFTNADYKFYLTASLDVRAKRWQDLQKKLGNAYSLEQSQAIVAERDKRDSERSIAPLLVPAGAIVIDSSGLDQDEVVSHVLSMVQSENL